MSKETLEYVVAKAKELIFTGKVILADEAKTIGLVNQVVAPESLMDEVKAMAEAIAKQAPIAVQKSKEAIKKVDERNSRL